MVGYPVTAIQSVTLPADVDRATGWKTLVHAVDSVEQGEGTLIMVDMFGGAPATLALSILAERNVEVLTGVNLAMVLRTILHRDNKSLAQLATEVLAYGQRNVTSSSHWLKPSPKIPTE